MSLDALPWGLVIIGGPLLLAVALVWARMRAGKQNRRIDPGRGGDDPAKGM